MKENPLINVTHELFAPAESSTFDGNFELSVLKAGPDLYEFLEPLKWNVCLTNTGDALLVTGEVEGVARATCARCLEGFDFPIVGELEGYFLISEDALPPEDLDEDEFSYLPKSNCIDLTEIINAALLLELSMIPLCNEECKGLCPQCGENLNVAQCACAETEENAAQEDKPNPFSVLKDFPFEEK